jgi:hypothetical protein
MLGVFAGGLVYALLPAGIRRERLYRPRRNHRNRCRRDGLIVSMVSRRRELVSPRLSRAVSLTESMPDNRRRIGWSEARPVC